MASNLDGGIALALLVLPHPCTRVKGHTHTHKRPSILFCSPDDFEFATLFAKWTSQEKKTLLFQTHRFVRLTKRFFCHTKVIRRFVLAVATHDSVQRRIMSPASATALATTMAVLVMSSRCGNVCASGDRQSCSRSCLVFQSALNVHSTRTPPR